MSDYEHDAKASYWRLADASEEWYNLERDGSSLQTQLAVATTIALGGVESEVEDVAITLDDGDPIEVKVVAIAADRVVLIDYEPEAGLRTRVLGPTAIQSVELISFPNLLNDSKRERSVPLAVRLHLANEETVEIGNHNATRQLRERLDVALPKILSRLP